METNIKAYTYKSNLGKRIAATIIDYGIIMLVTYLYIMYYGRENAEGQMQVEGIATTPLFMFWVTYLVFAETLFGATLGHHAFYLRVVTSKRDEITFGQALKRRLLDPIDLFWGIPAFIAISKSEKKQRLGDMWAETLVVDTKDPEQYRQPAVSGN